MDIFGLPPQAIIPLLAAGLGAVLGGMFTFASTYAIQRWSIKRRKKRLRRALVSEIRLSDPNKVQTHASAIGDHLFRAHHKDSNKELDQDLLEAQFENLTNNADLYLKSDVYDEILSEIGMFDEDQIDSILRYNHVMDDCLREFDELKYKHENQLLEGDSAEFLKFTISQLSAEEERVLSDLQASEFNEPDGFAEMGPKRAAEE